MSTCPWSIVVTVLCVGTLVRIGARETHNKGVHYKPKHLESARGTLVYPERIGQQHELTRVADPGQGKEIIAPEIAENYHVPRSFTLAIRPVPVDVYREAMTNARTHYDVFRIFLPLDLSDAEIDRMIWSTNAMTDVLTIIQGSGMPRFTPEQWKEWEKTKSETDEHGRCGKPVPQVVRVREILARGDEEYFPSCVLRYRCRRDAGCCQHEFQVCSATRSEKIEKTVLVAKVHSQDHRVHYQNLTMKTFTVDNDTACGCVEIVTPVEKPCPHPFVFDMESQKCKCRDVTFKKSCRRILRGEKELMPSDVRCIKEDKCRPLSICSYGNFDLARYQCPRKEDAIALGSDVRRPEKKRRRG